MAVKSGSQFMLIAIDSGQVNSSQTTVRRSPLSAYVFSSRMQDVDCRMPDVRWNGDHSLWCSASFVGDNLELVYMQHRSSPEIYITINALGKLGLNSLKY